MAQSFGKAIQTPLFTMQTVALGTVAKSSEVVVTRKISAGIYIQFGRTHASGLTLPMEFRVEGSSVAAGDGFWNVIGGASFKTLDAAPAAEQAVNGGSAAGQNVVLMALTTGFAIGQMVSIYKSGDIPQSEFGRIKAVSAGVSVTLIDNLLYSQASSHVYSDAQIYNVMRVSLENVLRLRLVADGSGCAQATLISAGLITLDDIGEAA